mmetsp:Transcript_87048/g.244118  ORF Transcript_87048/g.244118 Transcript_87048/m.244118 type:complete len:103 (+) Transcript_87048:172-480(+)
MPMHHHRHARTGTLSSQPKHSSDSSPSSSGCPFLECMMQQTKDPSTKPRMSRTSCTTLQAEYELVGGHDKDEPEMNPHMFSTTVTAADSTVENNALSIGVLV